MKVNNEFTRRDFLKSASAATLSALAAGYPKESLGQSKPPKIAPTAEAVIVLWMAGGMAHTETFDPKRFTDFAPGTPSNAVLSTFKPIDPVVDNSKFSQG